MKRIIIGITGASGSVYAERTISYLLKKDCEIHLVITDAGIQVANYELGWNLTEDKKSNEKFLREHFSCGDRLILHDNNNVGASIASGSYKIDGMVILPASMGCVSSIAHGSSKNLLERSADVILKEGRRLILVPRETPLNRIHLRNLLTLSEMDVTIIPAMPSFYIRPKTLDDIIDFIAGRVLDQLGIEMEIYPRWQGEE